jgi:hypothetical protein
LTRDKAIRALHELDHAGTPSTFAAVAGVSRSWLYRHASFRPPACRPFFERNRKLTEENQRLRRQLAHCARGRGGSVQPLAVAMI